MIKSVEFYAPKKGLWDREQPAPTYIIKANDIQEDEEFYIIYHIFNGTFTLKGFVFSPHMEKLRNIRDSFYGLSSDRILEKLRELEKSTKAISKFNL